MNRQQFNAMVAQYGEKTVTGMDGVEWSGGAHCYLPSLKFFGKSVRGTTPTPDAPADITDAIGFFVCKSNEEYITTPTLRGIGQYNDEWDYVTGKGIRRIKKIVADGETIKVDYASSKSGRITLTESGLGGSVGATAVFCTHFNTAWNTNHGSIYVLNANIVVMSMDGRLSIDEWNEWLIAQKEAGTPVTIYYVLGEPQTFEERPSIYEPIPNDNGTIWWGDGTMGFPYQVTYITHS